MSLNISRKPALSIWIVLFYAVLIGSMATIWGYRYGDGNQIEQLPIVMRAIDPSYLVNDFFTNATQGFGPRSFFAIFVATITRLFSSHHGLTTAATFEVGLPAVYLGLTILGNIGISFVTSRAARDLFDGSDLAGLIAAAAVMTLKTFWVGYSNIIYDYFLEPAHLAMPFLLLAVWAGLRRQPLWCALAATVAALFHPLMGLETGALMLGIILLDSAWQRFFRPMTGDGNYQPRHFWAQFGLGGLVFAGVAAAILVPYVAGTHIAAGQFIQILAFFRHPHHYIPSTFGVWQFLQAFVFLLPTGIAAYYGVQNSIKLQSIFSRSAALVITLVLLSLGGYLFVEVFPSRLWTTAQTLRLLYIIKWMGLVLIAGWVGFQLETNRRHEVAAFVLLASLISQLTLFLASIARLLKDWTETHLPLLNPIFREGLVLVFMVPLLLVFPPETRIYILFPFFALMAFCLFYWGKHWLAFSVNLGLAALVFIVTISGSHFLPATVMGFVDQPVITLAQLSGDNIDVAAFARDNTPTGAIFLTPPNLGEFRFTADRAIVVDFDAFPFEDQAMAEWQQRIFDCYGVPSLEGFDAVPQMRDNYTAISDDRLLALQAKYHFSYAVLYSSTATNFPILYHNKTFKLAAIKK